MSERPITLMHLSDIHFQRCTGGAIYDPDDELRRELERDAKRLHEELGDIDAILVTGDIAFSGVRAQYERASEWLQRLCGIVGCAPENVWTTPGNHDADWSEIKGSTVLRSLHRELATKDSAEVDQSLREHLQDSSGGPILFRSISHYNEFAARFGCEISATRPFWEHDLVLNDGSTLRLRGLNSTLISGPNDEERRLVLGELQVRLTRGDGVEYMSLCHHPPQWLRDGDIIEEQLNARARVLLFGHKHHQRVDKVNETLRLSAGAVHPYRSERNWQPRYNFLTLRVVGLGDDRVLSVRVFPRVWNEANKEFSPDYGPGKGREHVEYSLRIAPWSPKTPLSAGKPSEPAATGTSDAPLIGLGGSNMAPARRLVYRFFGLPYHLRMRVAQELGLLHDEDENLPDIEKFRRVFARAREQRRLGRLWDAVEMMYPADDRAENPFEKNE